MRLPPFMLLFSKTTHHSNTFLRSASTALVHSFSDARLNFKQHPNSSSMLNFASLRLPPLLLPFSKTTHHSNTFLRSAASTALAHSFSDAHLNFKQHPNSSSSMRLPPFLLLFSKTTHHSNTFFLRSAASTALAHSFSDAHLNFKQPQNSLISDSEIEFASSPDSESDTYFSSDTDSDSFDHMINEMDPFEDTIREMCYSGLDTRLELDSLIRIIIACQLERPVFACHDFFHDLFKELLKDVDVGVGAISNQNHDLLKAFDAFVKVFVRLNMFQRAIDLLFQIKSHGILPNLVACSFLINRLIKHGHGTVDMAYEVLQAYQGSLVPIEVLASYTTLIRWYCSNMEFDKAESLLLDMENQGIIPHVQIYSPLICGYCKAHNLHKALDLANDMISKGIKKNREILCCILHCLGEMGMDSRVLQMYLENSCQGMVWDGLAYNFILHAWCKVGHMKNAVGTLRRIKSLNFNLDIKHYTTLISGYCLQGKPDKAYSLFKEMKEKGFTPDAVTYTIMINSYCRKNCLQEAYGLFQDMKRREIRPDVITYTVLLDRSLKTATIWRDLKDVVSYTVLIDGHIKKDILQGAITLFDEVIDRGLEPDTVTYTALISGFYNNRGHTKKVVDLLNEISSEAALKRGIIKARNVQFH